MTTTRTMTMVAFMSGTIVLRGTHFTVWATLGQNVLIYVIFVRMMQMPVMQIVRVIVMLDSFMSTGSTVLVLVLFM